MGHDLETKLRRALLGERTINAVTIFPFEDGYQVRVREDCGPGRHGAGKWILGAGTDPVDALHSALLLHGQELPPGPAPEADPEDIFG